MIDPVYIRWCGCGLTDAVAHMDDVAAERRERARIETCEERDHNTPERMTDV